MQESIKILDTKKNASYQKEKLKHVFDKFKLFKFLKVSHFRSFKSLNFKLI